MDRRARHAQGFGRPGAPAVLEEDRVRATVVLLLVVLRFHSLRHEAVRLAGVVEVREEDDGGHRGQGRRGLEPTFPLKEEVEMQVKGRDQVMGLPKILTITSEEIRESLAEPASAIVDAVRVTLERTPPELSADIVDRGLVLAGGGALLRGFEQLISKETGLHVTVAEDPLTAVVLGTGKYLEFKDFKNGK